MKLTAIFENVDMAEWAIVRLREKGITPKSYKVRHLSPQAWQGESDDIPVFMPIPTNNSPTSGNGSMNGSWLPIPFFNSVNDRPREGYSSEAVLHVNVEDNHAIAAKGILVSNHGRKVEIVY